MDPLFATCFIPTLLAYAVILLLCVGFHSSSEPERHSIACEYCGHFNAVTGDAGNGYLGPFLCMGCGLLSMDTEPVVTNCGNCSGPNTVYVPVRRNHAVAYVCQQCQ